MDLYFEEADLLSLFGRIGKGVCYNVGLDLLDVADGDDRIPVFGWDVLNDPPAIVPDLKDVAAALAIVDHPILDTFP